MADEILTDFNSICNSLDVPWWIVAGTALGFYRDGAYIPWDTDIDVGIICTDDDYTKIFESLFSSYGFRKVGDLSKEGRKFRYGIGHAYRGGTIRQDSILLDIWRIGVEWVRGVNPVFFKVITWFDYKGMDIRIPHPIEPYLSFVYGSTWKVPQCGPKLMSNFISSASPAEQTQVEEMLR